MRDASISIKTKEQDDLQNYEVIINKMIITAMFSIQAKCYRSNNSNCIIITLIIILIRIIMMIMMMIIIVIM